MTLTIYFTVALIVGFLGMMYYHAMTRQGKKTDFEPEIIMPLAVLWFITIPACVIAMALMALNWMAKKASFILTSKEDE